MKMTLQENINRIKSLFNINEQVGKPCKTQQQIYTTSGETQIIGFIMDYIDRGGNIFSECNNIQNPSDKNTCILKIAENKKKLIEYMNALINKRDNNVELKDNFKNIYNDFIKQINKDYEYYFNRGTCARTATFTQTSYQIKK